MKKNIDLMIADKNSLRLGLERQYQWIIWNTDIQRFTEPVIIYKSYYAWLSSKGNARTVCGANEPYNIKIWKMRDIKFHQRRKSDPWYRVKINNYPHSIIDRSAVHLK